MEGWKNGRVGRMDGWLAVIDLITVLDYLLGYEMGVSLSSPDELRFRSRYEHLGGQRPGVVIRGHRESIGASAH